MLRVVLLQQGGGSVTVRGDDRLAGKIGDALDGCVALGDRDAVNVAGEAFVGVSVLGLALVVQLQRAGRDLDLARIQRSQRVRPIQLLVLEPVLRIQIIDPLEDLILIPVDPPVLVHIIERLARLRVQPHHDRLRIRIIRGTRLRTRRRLPTTRHHTEDHHGRHHHGYGIAESLQSGIDGHDGRSLFLMNRMN